MGIAERIEQDLVEVFSDTGKTIFESIHPPMDIYKKGDVITIDLDLPGFNKEDIECEIKGTPKFPNWGWHVESAWLHLKANKKSIIPKECETIIAHRPLHIENKLPLPTIRLKKDQEVKIITHNYIDNSNGIYRITFTLPKK